MPDLLAGSTVNALDTPPTVADFELDSFNFTHTTYAITGEIASCGIAFVAPTTGRSTLDYSCNIQNSTTATTAMTPVVREGGTVGSGTTFLAASDDNALVINSLTNTSAAGRRLLITGLTVGATYNVRLEHRVSAGTGTLARRAVTVSPAT